MPMYEVRFTYSVCYSTTVEVENEAEAEEKAEREFWSEADLGHGQLALDGVRLTSIEIE